MIFVYFTRSKIVVLNPLERGKTVTAKQHTEICLPHICKNVSQNQKKELRRYILRHDDASAHTAEITSNFFALSGIHEIRLAPDPAPCDFWLFSKINKELKRKGFVSNEDIINAVTPEIQKLKKPDFEDSLEKWL